ncbi:MAG: type VI secretion system protein TssA [Alphaproteobacteria bacterium]|nr:type VI secretion system protein TssA [Alphaproteobacteria bacterium]
MAQKKLPFLQKAEEKFCLSQTLSKPLSGSQETGILIRYEPIFDQIVEARQEESSHLPQGIWKTTRKRADWNLVDKLCQQVLTTSSKDLQIAVWLLEARFHIAKIPGLTEGLNLIKDLCSRFWDNLYPQLEEDGDYEFRLTPIDWLNQKFSNTLFKVPVTSPIDPAKPNYTMADFIHAEHLEHLSQQEKYGKTLLEQARKDGEVTLDMFSQSKGITPQSFYESLIFQLSQALEATSEVDKILNQKTNQSTSFLYNLRDNLLAIKRLAELAIEEIQGKQQVTAASPPKVPKDLTPTESPLQDNTNPAPVSDTLTDIEPQLQDLAPSLELTSRSQAYKFLEQILNYLKQTDKA